MEENNFITVDLNKTTDFNTVVLQERGKKVTLFQYMAVTIKTRTTNSYIKVIVSRAVTLAF